MNEFMDQFRRDLNGDTPAIMLKEGQFHITGYKVLRSFQGRGLLRAVKSELNGTLRIVYDTRGGRRLSSMLPDLTPGTFTKIAASLLGSFRLIRETGYLRDENVVVDPELVFVDPGSMEAGLIYLPIVRRQGQTGRLDGLEQQIREMLLQILRDYPQVLDANTVHFRDWISIPANGLLSGAEFLGRQGGEPSEKESEKSREKKSDKKAEKKAEKKPKRDPETWVKLVQLNVARPIILRIPPLGAVVGREPGVAQIIITEASVSRKHCRFWREAGSWRVEDLSSANGTALNGRRLTPNKGAAIKDGDKLQISKIQFLVSVESEDDEM